MAAGSVAGVFKGLDTLAFSIVNSGLTGHTPISANTIFPIWSMSRPITIVAMMILHKKGLYALNDPVSKYIPYFADLKCKDKAGKAYRCRNELKVVHLLTHRSGYGYYDRGKGPSHLDPYDDLDQFVKDVATYPAEFQPWRVRAKTVSRITAPAHCACLRDKRNQMMTRRVIRLIHSASI